MRTPFDHERLDAYRLALEFAARLDFLLSQCEVVHGPLFDQLKRAASSVCLNIAEGSGEFSPKEKCRFYRIARRSATECAAVLDMLEVVSPQRDDGVAIADGRETLARIVAMLVKLAKATESRIERSSEEQT